MQSDSTKDLIEKFFDSYRRLKGALYEFDASLQSALWADVRYRSMAPAEGLSAARDAYSRMIFADDGKSTGSYLLFGAVGATDEHVAKAIHVNNLKQEVESAVLAIRAEKGGTGIRGSGQLFKRDPVIQRMLESYGLARLNFRHVYRKIPVVPRNIKKISFSWTTHSRRVQRLTREEALAFLRARGVSEDVYEMAAKALAAIDPAMDIAYVVPIAPTMVANLWIEQPDGSLGRELIRSPLPILTPVARDLIDIHWPIDASEKKLRKKRSDLRIADQPIVPGLRLFPYLSTSTLAACRT